MNDVQKNSETTLSVDDHEASNSVTGAQSEIEFSAGQKLAAARQAMGLSLEDLSEQTRVPMNVLVAIENDQTPENLPETFLRGYIRSFAKKVGVNEADVLAEQQTYAASKPDNKAMHSFSKRNKRKKIERRLALVTWLIISILVIAFIAWWVQTKGLEMLSTEPTPTQNSQSLPVPFAAESNMPEALEAKPLDTVNTPKAVADPEPEIQQDINAVTSESTDVATDYPKSTLIQKTDTSNAEETNNSDASNSTGNTESELLNNQSPVVLSDAEKKLMAESGEATEDDFIRVEFKFENDCWVEVYDAFDDRIAVGNKPAGYLMTLNAQGPFRVLLGNPDGVSIWVNGEVFDMSELPTNRVARFEVDTVE